MAVRQPLLHSYLSGVVDPRLQCVSAQRSGTARHLLLRRRRRDYPDPAGDANSGDFPDRDSHLYTDRDADGHGNSTTDFDTDTVTDEHPHTSADCNSNAAAYCDGDTSADRHSYAATHFDTDAVTDEHPHTSEIGRAHV